MWERLCVDAFVLDDLIVAPFGGLQEPSSLISASTRRDPLHLDLWLPDPWEEAIPLSLQAEPPRLPQNYQPRGAAGADGTARRELDRHDQTTSHRRLCQASHQMSMLPNNSPPKIKTATLVTQ
jgi:hypothetical protein